MISPHHAQSGAANKCLPSQENLNEESPKFKSRSLQQPVRFLRRSSETCRKFPRSCGLDARDGDELKNEPVRQAFKAKGSAEFDGAEGAI
jgi:hypothetical protein